MKTNIKNNKAIIFYLTIFFMISIATIYSTLEYIPSSNIFIKQIIFYAGGFLLIFLIMMIKNRFILKFSFILYLINILLLVYVLFFGKEVNGSKAWIDFPFIGGFQPSEFMKIGLILFLAKTVSNDITNKKNEFIIILKSIIIFLIPTIFTFLEPDTGAVINYFIITVIILFISGIKKIWFILLFFIIVILGISIFYLYCYKQDLFIEILGSNFFYRLDRIFDWTISSGMQLKNSLISISSSGLFGHGFNNIPLYFPELQTDFIFASFSTCFGLLGIIIFFLVIYMFDYKIIAIGISCNSLTDKLIISAIISVLIYQQIQNISMTVGILPITGITLPFISYGGSSLISFMILIGIILNINNNIKTS